VEKIGAGIVTASGKNLPRARVHSCVIPLPLLGRAAEVGDVPHGNRGGHGDRAADRVRFSRSRDNEFGGVASPSRFCFLRALAAACRGGGTG